jgi:hypothetical protein
MILADSEVSSLKSALRCWEWFGYISTAIVGLGCIGEFTAEFTSLPQDDRSKHKLARLSLMILILGIAGELLSAVRTSQLSGQLIANIEERTTEANRVLEQERRTRIELEKSLRPRELYAITYTDGTDNFDNLKELKGTEFEVEAISDFEARKAASDIVFILEAAGLKVLCTGVTDQLVVDGVTVEQYLSPTATERDEIGNEMHSGVAARIFQEFLNDNDWVANGTPAKRGDLKPNELRIRVGYKPSPYFSQIPQWAKELEKTAQQNRRMTNSEKQACPRNTAG